MIRKTAAAVLLSILMLPAFSQSLMLDFEDFNLPPDSFWNGSDMSGGFSNEHAFFHNNFVDWGGGITSWDGFAYANKFNDTTQAFGNMYSTYAGNDSNGIHALSYMNSDWVNYEIIPTFISFTCPARPISIQISNSTFTALTILNGDFVSKKFGGTTGDDPDWFKLSIFGFHSGNGVPTDTIEFYLADYRFTNNNEDYIIKNWTSLDLPYIGIIDSLGFFLSSSDTGAYGMNTPAVFCFDNLYFQTYSGIQSEYINKIRVYPNPATDFVIIPDYSGEVSVTGVDGALLFTKKIEERLELGSLPKGIYVLEAGNKRTLISKMCE